MDWMQGTRLDWRAAASRRRYQVGEHETVVEGPGLRGTSEEPAGHRCGFPRPVRAGESGVGGSHQLAVG
jgi:hypothetical protein